MCVCVRVCVCVCVCPHRAPPANLLQVPFQGTSTYRDDFTKKNMPPKEAREKAPMLQSQNLDNYTTYGAPIRAFMCAFMCVCKPSLRNRW